MDTDIINLKDKATAEYESKLKEIKEEYDKKIEAIDIVLALIKNENEPIDICNETNKRKEPVMKATSQDVRGIIDCFDGNFSIHNIKREASTMVPPLDVSKNVFHNVIKRKRENGEIEIVKMGSGRLPAVYKNTDKYIKQ